VVYNIPFHPCSILEPGIFIEIAVNAHAGASLSVNWIPGISFDFIWVRFISVGKWTTLPQVAIFDTKTLGF